MKQRRLHSALAEASELRVFIVLLFVIYRRTWHFLPASIYILIAHMQRQINNRLTYRLYQNVHWVKG